MSLLTDRWIGFACQSWPPLNDLFEEVRVDELKQWDEECIEEKHHSLLFDHPVLAGVAVKGDNFHQQSRDGDGEKQAQQYLSLKENSKLDEDSKSVKKWKRVKMYNLLKRKMMNSMM